MLRRDHRALARPYISKEVPTRQAGSAASSFSTSAGVNNRAKANPPIKKSSTQNKSTQNKATQKQDKKWIGLPLAYDDQGRALFTRPSDGMLVYLRCHIEGCGRHSFGSVKALRDHVSGPKNLHKLKGIFSNNDHALEVCGVAVSDQQHPGSGPMVHFAESASSTAISAPPGMTSSSGPLGRSSSESKSEVIKVFDDSQNCSNEQYAAQNLGGCYQIRPSTSTTPPEIKYIEAEHAPETYEDLSSESEGEDKIRYAEGTLTDTLERPTATEVTHTSCDVPESTDLIETPCTVKEQQATVDALTEVCESAVKTEYAPPEVRFPIKPAEFPHTNSHYIASQVSDLEISEAEQGLHEALNGMTSRKRSAFTPPESDPQLYKRFRNMDGSLED